MFAQPVWLILLAIPLGLAVGYVLVNRVDTVEFSNPDGAIVSRLVIERCRDSESCDGSRSVIGAAFRRGGNGAARLDHRRRGHTK